MIIYKCDICEKELFDGEVYVAKIRHVPDEFRYVLDFPAARLDYEICSQCALKVMNYIENGGEEE